MDHSTTSLNPSLERLQLTLQNWQAFDLDAKKAELDGQATQIANYKEASVQARKNLAKQTQDFRKTSDEEKLQNIGQLLKLYQEEVDRLTKRCKTTETGFITLYNHLSSVQNPVPVLEIALDQCLRANKISDLEMENKKMHEELTEFHKEFQEVKNQEVTIRRLEDKVKEYETHMEGLVEEQAAANARKLREEHVLETELLREREAELRKQVDTAHEELKKVRRSYDTTQGQLLDLQVRYEDVLASRQAEVDLLSADLERATALNATLERERELWGRAAQEGEGGGPLGASSLNIRKGLDLELEVAQKEIEILRLHDQVQLLNSTLGAERERFLQEKHTLDTTIAELRKKCDELTVQYSSLPTKTDYDEALKELSILKAMVYSDSDEKDKGGTTVEQVLKEKNRHLEGEVTRLKLAVGEKDSEVEKLRSQLEQLNTTTNQQQELITQLEDDLAKGAATNPAPPTLDKLAQSAQLSNSSSGTAHPLAGSTDMFEIVCGQRDRFKARLSDVERENDRLRKQVESLRGDIQVFRSDNVKLYEKIRYLQSYGDISAKRGTLTDLEKQASTHDDDGLEGKYGQMYEENINPFTIFNRKERYKRYKDLNTAERVILNGSRFFLSNKSSRLFLFFYSLALHLLVFAAMYKLAHTAAVVCTPTDTSP